MHYLEKQLGETPLQAIQRLRQEKEISEEIPLSYAGRLDPMATGVLLILEGDECRERETYLAYHKEYVVDILLGAFSDTGDILGVVEAAPNTANTNEAIARVLNQYSGPYNAPYPWYASKTVQGKPLWKWAQEKRTSDITRPLQNGTIYDLHAEGTITYTSDELMERVQQQLAHAPSEGFRKQEVQTSWEQLMIKERARQWVVLTIRTTTSSGVYMRTLADDIGTALGSRGLALHIHRTRIIPPQ